MGDLHKDLGFAEGHISHSFEFASAAARLAGSFVLADEGKIVRQTDNDSFFILTDFTSPTFIEIGAADLDIKVAIDAAATADFIGALATDGVLRTTLPITYTDGGDFITLGIDETAINHDNLLNFVAGEHFLQSAISITASQVSDFDEAAQDAVGGILTNTSSIDFTYNDVANIITADVLPAGVDHDSLLNFVAGEHTDAQVKVTSNDTTADYLFNKLVAGSTKISIVETNDGFNEDVTIDVVEANIDHDALLNFVVNEHIDWTVPGAGTIDIDNYIEGGPGTDTTAIHDNVASEISAVTEKLVPIAGDFILIEDSAAANVKKRIQVGNLPFSANELDEQTVGSTTLTSTTSTTYVDLATMTLTTSNTVVKKYLVNFVCSFANSAREKTFFRIVVNGVAVAESETQFFIRENSTVALRPHPMVCQALTAAIGTGLVIKVQFHADITGTVEVLNRSLIITGVS